MTTAALSRALNDMTMERDAAVVAKEDLIAQLRVTKRRLKEAEDEQYRAEEDAATLRVEIQALQHSDQRPNYTPSSFISNQQEIDSMKSELEDLWQRLQQEQRKLAAEQQQNTLLALKLKQMEVAKQEAESTIAANRAKQQKEYAAQASSITLPLTTSSSLEDSGISASEKGKHELQLRELASMVERLEKGRQKLLGEIDGQSLEIERLFVENANLTSRVKESTEMSSQWENQVQQLLEHNTNLRSELNRLRMEQAASASAQIIHLERFIGETQSDSAHENSLETLRSENSKLKSELAKVLGQGEEWTAERAQLSANLNRAILASNTLGRIYRPVLSNIENRLLQLKQETPVVDTRRLPS